MHNTRRAFRFFKATGYVAALLTFTIESAMANSLLLLSPAQLAGSWTFYPQDDVTQACQVQLVADKTFSPEVKCLQTWLGEVPTSWSPTPDGLFLMGKDGRVLARFSPRTPPDDPTVIQAIEKAAGKEAILDLLPLQPGDVPDTFADSSALEDYVNYKPATSVVDGVKNFVDWYRQYHNI